MASIAAASWVSERWAEPPPWPAGARPEDGIWAQYWYHNLHRSTGFAQYRPKDEAVPDHIMPLYDACRIIYDKLYPYIIRSQAD